MQNEIGWLLGLQILLLGMYTLWRHRGIQRVVAQMPHAEQWLPIKLMLPRRLGHKSLFGILVTHPTKQLAAILPDGTLWQRSLPDCARIGCHRDHTLIWRFQIEWADELATLTALPNREGSLFVVQKRVFQELNPKGKTLAPASFDLDKSPACMLVLLACMASLAFAAVDSFVANSFEFVDAYAVMRWSPLALLITPLVYRYLAAAEVPANERLVLSGLLVFTLALSVLPGIRRIEQWRSVEGARNYTYRMATGIRLLPVDQLTPPLPELTFENTPEYWERFPVGSTHTFRLLRGPWGYWQIDYTELDKQHRAFYSRRRQGT